MPAMMIQATSARMYTMGLALVTIGAYLAYSLYRKETRLKWILFTVFSIAAVYVHTFCMLEMVVVYSLFILVVLRSKKFRIFRKILLSGVIVSIGFLPWLFVLFGQFSRWAGWESGWSNTIEQVSLSSLIAYLSEWFSSLEEPRPLVILLSMGLILYVSFFVGKYVRKSKDFFPCLGMLVMVIVFAMAMVVSIFIVPCFLGRYLFPLFGGLWLFVAVGINQIKKLWQKAILLFIILGCGLVTFADEVKLEDPKGLNTYVEWLDDELSENDVIMADNYFLMMMSIYYPDANYMIYGAAPECLPFEEYEVFQRWEQLEDVEIVWYLSFPDLRCGNLDVYYTCEKTICFPFSYYNIVLEKYVRNAE